MNLPRDSVDPAHLRLLDALATAARAEGARAFLVGGPVRDLLLGAPLRDLDLAVEGDAAATARSFASATGAALRPIEGFLTFKLFLGEREEIDIATTRRESYERPGALPRVEPASISEDLYRRDFSINAIALEIEPWELVDPAGGIGDLGLSRLRVLHSQSFSDDPTRVLRGIRLATRLGFGWDPGTATLLDEAIEGDALLQVSRERIWRELLLADAERHGAGATLLAMASCGALARTPGVARNPDEGEAIASLDARPELLTITGADPRIVRFALLLAGSAVSAEALRGAPFTEKQSATLMSIASNPRELARELEGANDDATRFRLLDRAPAEARAVAALVQPALEEPVERFSRAASADLGVRGGDLGVPPGPWVGSALRDTRLAIYSRAISLGEAPAFARRAAVHYLRGQDRNE